MLYFPEVGDVLLEHIFITKNNQGEILNMKRLVITTLLVLALTVSAFAGSFADVPSNHWAYEAVNELVAAGLIQGYPDGTFKGQNNLTRYEVATMIARLLDALAEARAELIDQVDFMIEDAILTSESGLSAAQAEDVQTILQAVIDKNQELLEEQLL